LHRVYFFRPLPFAGTELAEKVADFFKFKKDAFDPLEVSYLSSDLNISAISNRDLRNIVISAYLRFYLSPERILPLIIYHPNFLSLPYYAFLALTHTLLRLNQKRK
jgi:hypothetical protein